MIFPWILVKSGDHTFGLCASLEAYMVKLNKTGKNPMQKQPTCEGVSSLDAKLQILLYEKPKLYSILI